MRTLTLARLAAESEVLLLRRQATIVGRRIAYGVIAAAFGVAVLVLLHLLGYIALVQFAQLAPFYAALVVLAVDLLFLLIFALMATGRMTDPLVAEARLVRDQSIEQMRETLTVAAMVRPAARLLGRKQIYGVVLAALTARFLGSKAK
jgi:hypothetical protein